MPAGRLWECFRFSKEKVVSKIDADQKEGRILAMEGFQAFGRHRLKQLKLDLGHGANFRDQNSCCRRICSPSSQISKLILIEIAKRG